jgi:hypothetical protein
MPHLTAKTLPWLVDRNSRKFKLMGCSSAAQTQDSFSAPNGVLECHQTLG